MFLHTPLGQFNYACFTLLSLFAIVGGRRIERWAGLVLFVVNLLTPLVQYKLDWMDQDARFFLVDLAVLAFFLPMALVVGRVWTLFAAAFQLLSTLSHPTAHLLPRIDLMMSMTVDQVCGYGVYSAAGVGALASLMKRRENRRDQGGYGRESP